MQCTEAEVTACRHRGTALGNARSSISGSSNRSSLRNEVDGHNQEDGVAIERRSLITKGHFLPRVRLTRTSLMLFGFLPANACRLPNFQRVPHPSRVFLRAGEDFD